jgi:hypothetical protein
MAVVMYAGEQKRNAKNDPLENQNATKKCTRPFERVENFIPYTLAF